jgi:MFS family permease
VESGSGYLELVRSNRNYRFLWCGEIVSLLGDWFTFVASATLVARLTGSGLAVGALFVVRMLPPFLVSPVAGVVADRFNRKWVLIVTDLVRALTVTGFLWVREPAQVWLLYALTALQLGMSGFFYPARNAILPDLVSGRQLGTANALSSVTWSTMLAFGAALGGLVAGRFGVAPAFAIDAASYLVSAFLLTRVAYRPAAQAAGVGTAGAALRSYFEGLDYLRRHRDQFYTALHKGAFGLFMSGFLQVVQVTLAQSFFVIGDGGSTSFGLMYGVAGLGTGVGPIVVRRLTGDHRRRLRAAIAWTYVTASVGLCVMAPLAGFLLFLVGLFVRGVAGGINWVFSTQLLMQSVVGEVRGRVFGTEFALFTLAQAIGTGVGGWAIDNSGLGAAGLLWLSALLMTVPGLLWALWLAMTDRRQA